jgi:hypothetical protein
VLVVVEDGDVELAPQAPLDLEAARRRDVLEVDPAESRRDRLHDRDDLVGVGGVEADRPGVDPGELLEEHRLALHHRHGRLRADVPKPQDGRPVGHDGDRVLLDRERPHLVGVGGDREAHAGDARRIGHREVVARLHRHLVLHLDLAAQVHEERAVGDVHDGDPGDVPDGVDDPLAVVGVGRRHRDVAHAALA